MTRSRTALAAALLSLAAVAHGTPSAEKDAALAAEVERWAAFLRGNTATDDLWKDVKGATEPALGRTQKALEEGHPLLALLRFSAVQQNLAAAAYLGTRAPEQRKDMAAFEAEWKRMGEVLRPHLGTPPPGALDGVGPAALRGLGEAALPQVRIYYEASVEYGRQTMPDAGLFYLGAAQAARDFAALARTLSSPSSLRPPPLRGLAAELDSLETEMLAAYRPPLSIDKHGEFIGASSALKEAREMDAAGLRHGALLRYLQAVLRFAMLRGGAAAQDAPVLAERLRGWEGKLQGELDHTLGRTFLELARSDLAEHATGGAASAAAAVASDVLPRYFAALEPAPSRTVSAPPAPRVTVTLVRWPYT